MLEGTALHLILIVFSRTCYPKIYLFPLYKRLYNLQSQPLWQRIPETFYQEEEICPFIYFNLNSYSFLELPSSFITAGLCAKA